MKSEYMDALSALETYSNYYLEKNDFEIDLTKNFIKGNIKNSVRTLKTALKNEANTDKLLAKLDAANDKVASLKDDVKTQRKEIKELTKLCKKVPRYTVPFCYDDVRDGGYYYCPSCYEAVAYVNCMVEEVNEEDKLSKCPKCKQLLKWRT